MADPEPPRTIDYSEKYQDDTFEYRHVVIPREVGKKLNLKRLLSEEEWRALGIQQSRGWVHYAWHRPEPHVLLFRRALGTDPVTGEVDPVAAAAARAAYRAAHRMREEE